MKKIIFLIISLSFSVYVIAQQSPSSEVVKATMPRGATKLSGEQLSGYVHDHYKRSQLSTDRKNIYKLDGILISFWDMSVNPDFKKSLTATQSEMLEAIRESNQIVNDSKIITVNNIQFLIYEYQKDDEVFLRFQSEYNNNNKNICGIIQFKKPDEDKAHKALQEFLESVHFKE